MFCGKCGKENLNDAKFCSNCGALLTTAGWANEPVWRVAPSLLQPEGTGSAVNFAPMPAPPKKRKIILPIVLCSVGAVLLVLIAVFVFMRGGKLGADPGGAKAAAVVQRMYDAYEAQDIDALVACYFPAQREEAYADAYFYGEPTWEEVPSDRIYEGHRAAEEYEDAVRNYLYENYETPKNEVDAVYIVPVILSTTARPPYMGATSYTVIEVDGNYYCVETMMMDYTIPEA